MCEVIKNEWIEKELLTYQDLFDEQKLDMDYMEDKEEEWEDYKFFLKDDVEGTQTVFTTDEFILHSEVNEDGDRYGVSGMSYSSWYELVMLEDNMVKFRYCYSCD